MEISRYCGFSDICGFKNVDEDEDESLRGHKSVKSSDDVLVIHAIHAIHGYQESLSFIPYIEFHMHCLGRPKKRA